MMPVLQSDPSHRDDGNDTILLTPPSSLRSDSSTISSPEPSDLSSASESEAQIADPVASLSPLPRIHNVVGRFDSKTPIDLNVVALHCRNVEYRKQRFPAAVMRIREPKATGLIFSTGKVVLIGTKSQAECRLAGRKFVRALQKLGFPAVLDGFRVTNIVANLDVGFYIRLEGIQYKHSRFARYEPEIFPGLAYQFCEPKLTALIFTSGKVVFTGASSQKDINKAAELLYPVLKEFRKINPS